jgi:hypothetical protein
MIRDFTVREPRMSAVFFAVDEIATTFVGSVGVIVLPATLH